MTTHRDVEARRGARKALAAAADEKTISLQQNYGEAFYKFARSRGLCHDDALNVVQTSLLAMRDRLMRKPVKNVLPYFWAVIKNQTIQFYRERNNAKEKPLGGWEDLIAATSEQPADQLPDEIFSPGKQLMLRAANQAIEELSEPLREVFELAVIGELEPSDIALMLEKKSGTVRAYLSMARKQVKARADVLLAELELREQQKHCGEK
jgi:RNA polymerase sigma factor (sigma-70 family)